MVTPDRRRSDVPAIEAVAAVATAASATSRGERARTTTAPSKPRLRRLLRLGTVRGEGRGEKARVDVDREIRRTTTAATEAAGGRGRTIV